MSKKLFSYSICYKGNLFTYDVVTINGINKYEELVSINGKSLH